MTLMEPTPEYGRQIQAYRKEFLDCGDSMDGTSGLRHFDDPKDWIEHINMRRDPVSISTGLAPASQFIYVRAEDSKIVGMMDIILFFI